jgi:hypothetical protein
MFVSPYFKEIRNQILDELGPFDIDTEVQIRIGPGLISFGGFVASFTKVDDHTLSYLRDIRNVEVGVYNLKSDQREKHFSIPSRVSKILARKGYEPLVKSKDHGETTWVMTKLRKKRLEALYVISVEKHELVLVEVRGRLERLIEKAITEHGFKRNDFIM